MTRVVEHTHGRLAAFEVADGNAIVGNPARIVRGAVDGVDDPQPLSALAAFLFADDPVIGIPGGDRGANESLHFAIHCRDDVVASLECGLRLSKGGMGELAGVAREL